MKILELHLLSPDLSKTASFYQSVLGVTLLQSGSEHLQLQCGETTLNFKSGKPCIYHIAFEIPNNKFEEAFEWMDSRVDILPVEGESKIADFVNWKAKSFYFLDPLGNVLEYIARFKAPTASRQHFTGSSLLYVSEIGIVTGNVQQAILQSAIDFNVPIFHRQPPTHDFAALGDDHGLFILVSKDRPWYPTKIPSVRCFTRIVFEQNGNQFDWTISED